MAISLIHTADFQIGKRFGNMPAEAALLLRRQRIKTVRRVSELANERRVDAVLVAGDVFEFDGVSNETLHAVLDAMSPFPGPWVLMAGNHDPALPESVWNRLATIEHAADIHLAVEPGVVTVKDGRIAILTAPLQRKHETEDITGVWDGLSTPDGVFRVGLAHGSVAALSPLGSAAPNPIAIDRETTAHLDYLALGDWHGTMTVSNRTCYSGTPEPDRFKANDSGNVLLVRIDSPGARPEIEKIRVGEFSWRELDCSLNCSEDLVTLESKLRELEEPHGERIVAVRLSGSVDLETRVKLSQVLEQWRARFLHLQEQLEGLVSKPTSADLDRVDTGGFIRTALDRLVGMQDDPRNPDREQATAAVELLYRIHAGAGNR